MVIIFLAQSWSKRTFDILSQSVLMFQANFQLCGIFSRLNPKLTKLRVFCKHFSVSCSKPNAVIFNVRFIIILKNFIMLYIYKMLQ